jgi:hypothetical protein
MEKRKIDMEGHEKKSDQPTDLHSFDSPINTADAVGPVSENKSLTRDEDAALDPNQVENKPSFDDIKRNHDQDQRFDGEIRI